VEPVGIAFQGFAIEMLSNLPDCKMPWVVVGYGKPSFQKTCKQ